MAYVAISNGLLNDVRSQIEKMKERERATVKPPANNEQFVAKDDETVMKLLWGEHLHLKDQMPEKWKTHTRKVTMSYRVQSEHDYNNAFFTYACNSDEGFEIPRSEQASYYGVDVKFETEEQCPPIMAASIEYTKQVTDIDSRWKKVREDVLNFLNNCKSLNEAVKLWPQFKMYVHKHYIDRMEKNSPSAKKSAEENAALKALQSIDTDFVVAAAVGARMAQAAAEQSA